MKRIISIELLATDNLFATPIRSEINRKRDFDCLIEQTDWLTRAKHLRKTMTCLQLHLSANNLKNSGGFFGGKSDPFAVVAIRGDNENNKAVLVGQTDVYVIYFCALCYSLLYLPSANTIIIV